MAKREKEIVWHKKKAKFLPVSLEYSRRVQADTEASVSVTTRRQQFADNLLKKIRNAVNKDSSD